MHLKWRYNGHKQRVCFVRTGSAKLAGHVLILTMSLLPVLSWLSWETLMRGTHLTSSTNAYAGLHSLRAAALRNIAAAIADMRNNKISVGITQSQNDGISITRKVARLTPVRSRENDDALTGFTADAVAQSPDGAVTLRLSFLFRAGASAEDGVWHISWK